MPSSWGDLSVKSLVESCLSFNTACVETSAEKLNKKRDHFAGKLFQTPAAETWTEKYKLNLKNCLSAAARYSPNAQYCHNTHWCPFCWVRNFSKPLLYFARAFLSGTMVPLDRFQLCSVDRVGLITDFTVPPSFPSFQLEPCGRRQAKYQLNAFNYSRGKFCQWQRYLYLLPNSVPLPQNFQEKVCRQTVVTYSWEELQTATQLSDLLVHVSKPPLGLLNLPQELLLYWQTYRTYHVRSLSGQFKTFFMKELADE